MNEILSSMQSSQWYDHFRGAIYPLNLEKCSSTASKTNSVKTLIQIAASFIVRDSTTTLQAINIVPQELCVVLMQQALEGNRDRAVDALLTKWPHPTLTIRKFAPDIFSSLNLLHDHVQLTKVAKQGLRYTTCVAHNFLETLKKKTATKLKYLDMTGYPTAEVITYYLATHCMLAHNEARQNMMIRKYEEAIKLLPDNEESGSLEVFQTDHSLPEDATFVVKFDAFLTSENALSEICKALKVSSFKDSTLKLVVEKLDVTCLGEQKIRILLEQLNTEFVHGLRLKYNSLSAEDFISLSPTIATFTNITALDLSCNCVNVFQSDTACDAMAQLFTNLPNLVRLDLSNNRLKTKLRRVLSAVKKPLRFLRLAGCGLQVTDMTYLAMSHHTTDIQELDISENGLGNCTGILVHLLRNIRLSIHVLELEDSSLNDSHIESLFSYSSFKQLSSLMYLNISGNSLSSESLCLLGRSLAGLCNLQYFYMSYPRECYQAESDEAQEDAKKDFASIVASEISTEQQLKYTGKSAVPVIVFSELDQEMG